jgi:endoglucanase
MVRRHPVPSPARALGVLFVALAAMVALGFAGRAASEARPGPAGIGHQHRHHHQHRRHHHKRHHKHPRTHRHHRRSGAPRTVAPAPTPAPTPTPAPAPVSMPAPAGDPLAGDRFYVNPSDSAIVAQAQLRSQGQTAQAAAIGRIAAQPEATWLTSDGSASMVPRIMSAAAAKGTVPVLVAYDIPWRDCGGYSSGGAADAAHYESFIDSLTAGLGQGKAVVIVEPDALSDLSCLSTSQRAIYDQLIGYAVRRLDTDAHASVYVDVGNPGWQPAATEAAALRQAVGTARAGFAVNVSNFYSPTADIAYGDAVAQRAGGRHFVVDTSRAGGNVTPGQWCNPSGAAIGTAPTTNTGHAGVDAFLWIKDVGESDGSCNGGPPAGQFWLSYALSLVGAG